MKRRFKLGNHGDSTVSYAGFVLGAFAIIALWIAISPVVSQQQDLDTYANEICRTAALSGRIGQETNDRIQQLTNSTGLSPQITWSSTGNIQQDQTITVTVEKNYVINLGKVGSFSFPLHSKASQKSEVYWK